jgi:hypothetical protein
MILKAPLTFRKASRGVTLVIVQMCLLSGINNHSISLVNILPRVILEIYFQGLEVYFQGVGGTNKASPGDQKRLSHELHEIQLVMPILPEIIQVGGSTEQSLARRAS